jgi:nucleoside-diphosphate-sugar epimerase
MTQISLLGCGWLGFPLAKSLIENGFVVKGSTTSEEKILKLKEANIIPFLIQVEEEKVVGEMDAFLQDSSILIIDIPPKLRTNLSESFVSKIKTLLPFIEKSSVKKILFVSSTSVYADDNSMITEELQPKPETESGKQLLEVETLLMNTTHFQTTVLRFGGLIGDDRHPIRFLSGRNNIENPDAPINLIHQTDCIGIIHKIIETSYWNEIFNAVAPYHPTRKEYYTQKALELNLVIPQFNESKPSIGKTILSDKLTAKLNYTFKETQL